MRFRIDHWYCCDPNLAMCGADVTDFETAGGKDPAPNCRMCKILFGFPCKPGCYGTPAGIFTPYVTRKEPSWSALSALKETTARVRDALVSINLRLRGFL